ncbi:MAG TPA: 4-hydroxy-3-methylbut-2-en-1-yl diphosphate synthase, partial [Acholeplasmatales bacterium]|nr:4-hydroxy-3-methylbut-2-en-1-yl diphosphate synthase [Acholeplasmatales bacterium]
VAIMGCAVNGPGEAAEADIAIAGGANGALLIKNGKIIRRIEQADLISELKKEIFQYISETKRA